MQLKHSGELSPAQRAKHLRDTRRYVREQDQAKLKQLRREVLAARKRRAEAVAEQVRKCRLQRLSVKQLVKEYRATEAARVNAEADRMRAAAREHCAMRKEAIKASGLRAELAARKILAAERQLQRELAASEQHAKLRQRQFRKSAKETRQESDDEVRANIDAELTAVFDRVRRSIKPKGRISRTEAFLQWVEENPSEVISLQQDAADVELNRLLKAQAKAEREAQAHSRRDYAPSQRELEKYLANVPF